MNLVPIDILMIEDNPGDIELVRACFEDARVANRLSVISDGQEALDFIQQGSDLPDIILLDINLPKVDGFCILQAIREGQYSRDIPVVMLTSSEAEDDINQSYRYKANSYVSKPVYFDKFFEVISTLGDFWMAVVKLPASAVEQKQS